MIHAEEKSRYFRELARNLQYEGFSVGAQTEDGCLPVELDGQRLCLALAAGGVRYREEDVTEDARSAALYRVIEAAKTTAEYMRQMESAPPLTASGLEGDYRLLAEFNDVVLAGHPTRYGVQFITWEQIQNRTALYGGNYYGPDFGIDSYTAAKRDFAVRSGLIPRSALFAPEQLAEVYRSIYETLEDHYPIANDRRKLLESAAEQIEQGVPDLAERVYFSNQRELELADTASQQDSGMQFN